MAALLDVFPFLADPTVRIVLLVGFVPSLSLALGIWAAASTN